MAQIRQKQGIEAPGVPMSGRQSLILTGANKAHVRGASTRQEATVATDDNNMFAVAVGLSDS